MDVIGILKQKGGSGATTIAVHLALAAIEDGQRVCIVDVDPQQSAMSWAAARSKEEPPVIAGRPDELGEIIAAAASDGYELVIIDTPPHSSAATAAVARVSGLAIIPTRPSALDLAALPATLQIVKATKTPALLVLNACPPRVREVEEARELLETEEGESVLVWMGQLGERTAFRRSLAYGLAVTEMEPGGKAAAEVRELWSYIRDTWDVIAK